MFDKIRTEKVKQITVEDMYEDSFSGNEKRKLTEEEKEKFIRVIRGAMGDNPYVEHLKFKIEFQDGDSLDVITQVDKIQIGDEFYKVHPYSIEDKFAFDKIANYHPGINKKLELLGLKSEKPTDYWIEHYLTTGENYIYTVNGIYQAEVAFDIYIFHFITTLDGGIDKEKAHSFLQELYNVFNDLDEKGLLQIDTEMREEICSYAESVLNLMGFYEKDIEMKYGIKRDW